MPTVPQYNGPQVQDTAAQPAYQSTPEGTGRAAAGLSQALAQSSDAIGRMAQTAASQQAFDAELKTKSDWLSADQDLRKQFAGASAIAYPAAVDEYWTKQREKLSELPSLSRQIADKSIGIAAVQAKSAAIEYATRETDRAQTTSFEASKAIELQRGLTDGRPEALAATREVLMQRNAQQGALKGWSTETVQAANLKDLSVMHLEAVTRMAQNDPKAAQLYFDKNRDEIDATRADGVQRVLGQLTAAADGEALSDQLWHSLGPKQYNQPIDRTAMEDAARAKFGADKPRLQAALQAIKERAAAFNSSEAEYNAGNVNAVMGAYAARPGMTVAQLQRLPQFQSLPGEKQAQIVDRVDSHINSMVSRAAASEARADSAESRQQRRLERQGFASYLHLSDPAVLSTMTEAQVQAQLPVLGNDLTKQLTEKFRSIDRKAAGKDLTEARMDEESFKHVANEFGYKSFGKMSATELEDVGELKYRVERTIALAQVAKKAKLTEGEKEELMRQEMTRTVKTNGVFGTSLWAKDKPVIALRKSEVDDVIVPAEDRKQIVDALRQQYQKTGDTRYAPTEDNLRRLYLRGKSRTADFLPSVEQPADPVSAAIDFSRAVPVPNTWK